MRIVVFVGSPIAIDEKELMKVAKKLKKEKVNVDIVSFGEEVSGIDFFHNLLFLSRTFSVSYKIPSYFILITLKANLNT